MDSESLAAAGLLAALSRASEILADLHHPFIRSERFSYFLPPAGVRVGTVFMLPDGRELRFEVSIAATGESFHVTGAITTEDEPPLLQLPGKNLANIHDGLAVFDDYAGEVAAPAARIIDRLLDGIV
ncbi:hypothetical protein [Nonomuraea jiangxiensis]|uniref:Uncharacterized protein n=1 Tax=Nonomuraea jiangxiensis TaxID=633440 RepID=A0A1G8MHH5_9ACTN|nr:hypothetical protein [Nonomuraea jiangxiensis]SDI67409.1 hypothetical protein SAMN05421869_106414 [Nonomuraea jiangxiensis]